LRAGRARPQGAQAKGHVTRQFVQQTGGVGAEGVGLGGIDTQCAHRPAVDLDGQGNGGLIAARQGLGVPGRALGLGMAMHGHDRLARAQGHLGWAAARSAPRQGEVQLA
jgi:hypothetical protein